MNLSDLLQAGYRYGLSLTHDEANAEDLLQDAWLRIQKNGLRPDKSLLFRIIRNRHIDLYRRSRLVVFEPLDFDPHDFERGGNAHEEELPYDAKQINDALSKLNPDEREALYLHAVEGKSASHIAKKTERSRNTVLSLIRRSKIKMSQLLLQNNSHQEIKRKRGP